eukprot:4689560-Prymnesium_polylepis.1
MGELRTRTAELRRQVRQLLDIDLARSPADGWPPPTAAARADVVATAELFEAVLSRPGDPLAAENCRATAEALERIVDDYVGHAAGVVFDTYTKLAATEERSTATLLAATQHEAAQLDAAQWERKHKQ